jgi:hypothetical protein
VTLIPYVTLIPISVTMTRLGKDLQAAAIMMHASIAYEGD